MVNKNNNIKKPFIKIFFNIILGFLFIYNNKSFIYFEKKNFSYIIKFE